MAIDIRPDFAMHFNLGLAYHALQQVDQALDQYRTAARLKPDWPEALNSIGVAELDLGFARKAAQSFRTAIGLANAPAEAGSNFLLARLYDPDVTAAQLAEEHRAWGAAPSRPDVASAVRPPAGRPCREGERIFRLAFLSGDLRIHPVGLLIEGLLQALMQHPVHVTIYSNNPWNDEVTARIRAAVPAWRDVAAQSDTEVERLVRGDDIDVLIDLSGHSAHNRLGVLALRPAPVQATWLGYGATTGLRQMDYILVDPYSVRAGEETQYTEKPWSLPDTRLLFTPPMDGPAVSDLPALRSGAITFGCFNNLAKLNERVVGAWGRIMTRVPDARLLLKSRQYDQPSARAHALSLLEAAGIDARRVELDGFDARTEYLAAYSKVDIALDPFPFTGGTTSLEGLWMGVPVLTLSGDRLIARQGESILKNLKMHDWIAMDEDDYVEKAVVFCRDLSALETLRLGLRARLQASPLCDAATLARHFVEAANAMRMRLGD